MSEARSTRADVGGEDCQPHIREPTVAAEFLAPVDEVLSMRNDGWDEPAIAEVFAVAADVVERQIENADRIALACR